MLYIRGGLWRVGTRHALFLGHFERTGLFRRARHYDLQNRQGKLANSLAIYDKILYIVINQYSNIFLTLDESRATRTESGSSERSRS